MHNSATPNARSRAGSEKVDRKPSRVRSTIKKMISVLDRFSRFASELNYFWKVCQSQFDFEFDENLKGLGGTTSREQSTVAEKKPGDRPCYVACSSILMQRA